jgi:hypothetical protein
MLGSKKSYKSFEAAFVNSAVAIVARGQGYSATSGGGSTPRRDRVL